ncbi:FMN-linked oxidoreductase [Cristinia sonorae]|uniref:FMN-linked oxidoreductase n=1 Tax=Cristinia sonorae TaxID=1940300 RepID=A0A8K0UG79_9AGAR|nr:FMN-linked oxidoreductase [Cristinia sonorae]
MCQYSAENGIPTDWHFAHIGSIISRGPGFTMMEATAVVPEGRITPQDLGLWSDDHIAPFHRITQFAHSQNQKIGVQLAHAGRKSSTTAPWLHPGKASSVLEGGWPGEVRGPTDEAFVPTFATPKALEVREIEGVVKAYKDAAVRAMKAGFDVIGLHGGHGYLLHSFMSPAVNNRTDEYGGSFENRIRLTVEVVDAIRAVIPPTMPLVVRVSGTDWLEDSGMPSWTVEDTANLAHVLAEHGVDVVDVSSGGNSLKQKIVVKGGPAYQVPLAEAVKKSVGDKMIVSTVGAITTGKMANEILENGQADAVCVGRQFLKNPGTVWAFADDLGVKINMAHQYEWGFLGRGGRGSKPVPVSPVDQRKEGEAKIQRKA